MDAAAEMYQETILEHSKRPRNHKRIEGTDHQAAGNNPLCGDEVEVFLTLDGEGPDASVTDVGFQGRGCAISQASASVMTELIKGRRVAEVEELFGTFQQLVAGKAEDDIEISELGKMAPFSGVRRFPTRVKCAILGWHTLKAALRGKEDTTVTTE